MHNNNRDLSVQLSETYKNAVGLIDVLRLSMLPKAVKTSYPTVVEDNVTYYLLNYERFNNISETLKIPHLTEYISSLVTTNYISPNRSSNGIIDPDADSLIFNYNTSNIKQLAFVGNSEIHNVSYNKKSVSNYKDIIMGDFNGDSVIIDYDFENLIDYDTLFNGYYLDNELLTMDIVGPTSIKYSKQLRSYTGKIPTATFHGVHAIFPGGIGFDSNNVKNNYIKQSVYDKVRYTEFISEGFIFSVNTDDPKSITINENGIKVNSDYIYDIKNNYLKNINVTRVNMMASKITSSFLSNNRFRTLNYSYNDVDDDGMVLGWTDKYKQPIVGINYNNIEAYFTGYNVGFKDDNLRAYFSASYFDFNMKIKFYKIMDEGDIDFSWGSYWTDTRNIFARSRLELLDKCVLHISETSSLEIDGGLYVNNGSLKHLSHSIQTVTGNDKLDFGHTVYVVSGDIAGTSNNSGSYKLVYTGEGMGEIGTQFTVYNLAKSGTNGAPLRIEEPTDKGVNIVTSDGNMEYGETKTFIKITNDKWITISS